MFHYWRQYQARKTKQVEASIGGDRERNDAVQSQVTSNNGGSMSPGLKNPCCENSVSQKTSSVAVVEKDTMNPGGATCYICLDGGPDEKGKPLARDCSCRGDSNGFFHMSCFIEYAKEKSKLHWQYIGFDDRFEKPWCAW